MHEKKDGDEHEGVVSKSGNSEKLAVFSWLKASGRKKIIIFLAVLTVLAGAGVFAWKSGYFLTDKTEQEVQIKPDCSKDSASEYCIVLKEAVELLDPSKVKELSVVVEKIKKLEGYDKDSNYLYVILTYYINLSDAENARITYDLLINVFNSESGYDPIVTDAKIPEDLEPIVVFLEKTSEEADKHSLTVPPEPQ